MFIFTIRPDAKTQPNLKVHTMFHLTPHSDTMMQEHTHCIWADRCPLFLATIRAPEFSPNLKEEAFNDVLTPSDPLPYRQSAVKLIGGKHFLKGSGIFSKNL